MVRITDILYWAVGLCIAVTVAGCGKAEYEVRTPAYDPTAQNAVEFRAADNWGEGRASAATTRAEFAQGTTVYVHADYIKDDGSVQFFMRKEEVTRGASGWTYSPAKYWPQDGTVLFRSCTAAPAATMFDGDVARWTLDGATDVMLAAPVAKMPAQFAVDTDRTVSFSFSHLLTRLAFRFKLGGELEEGVKVTSISIGGQPTVLAYNLAYDAADDLTTNMSEDNRITASGSGAITHSNAEGYPIPTADGVESEALPYLLFWPAPSGEPAVQTLDLTIKTDGAGTYEGSLKLSAPAAGGMFVVNVTVSDKEIVFDGIELEEWTDGGEENLGGV